MTINDIQDFKSKCSHMRFIPSDLLDDNRLCFRASYKNKKGQITFASFLCNPDNGHVDEIHYSKKKCNSIVRVLKSLAICLNEGDWEIDDNTLHYFSIRYSKFNKETRCWEKIHTLEKINNILSYEF